MPSGITSPSDTGSEGGGAPLLTDSSTQSARRRAEPIYGSNRRETRDVFGSSSGAAPPRMGPLLSNPHTGSSSSISGPRPYVPPGARHQQTSHETLRSTRSTANLADMGDFSTQDEIHPAQQSIREQTRIAQQRAWAIRELAMREGERGGASRQFVEALTGESQEVINLTVILGKAGESLGDELSRCRKDSRRSRTGYNTEIQDNQSQLAQSRSNILDLEAQLKALAEKHQKLQETIVGMQRKQFEDSKTIQRLMEQLDGKRNLWVEFHKSPDERAQAWEMFSRGQPPVTESTSTAEDDLQEWQPQGTTKDHGYPMSSIAAMPPISGSQHNARSVSQAPHGEYGASRNHPKAHSVSSYDAELERTRGVPATSDHGSPRPRNAGTSALVVASKPGDEAAALLWNADFAKLFDVILRFCQKYTGSSSHKGFYQGVPEQNPSSWRNICEVLYPQSQMGASSNQAHLLTDDSARPYFVQRLIIQMITVGVFEYEGLSGFNDRTNKELQDIDSRLAATEVFKPHERLALVDRRAEIVKNLFSHPSWKAFYAYKKNNFLAKLRPTVGAIIPTNLKSDLREQMSWDLSEATDEAWKLAAKLWQARVTFKYIWYAYGEKFQVDNHHALNSNLDAAILEQRQARLKLAATPAVILRNDQTMAIMAKRVMKADVLVMS